MTIVRDLEGEGHAILTVRTDRAISSSTISPIRSARGRRRGYRFIEARSRSRNPNVWLSVAPAGAERSAAR